jgi:hypothetical protein
MMKPPEDVATFNNDIERFSQRPDGRPARALMRSEGVLSEIENSTYAVLRAHESSSRKTA